MMANLIEDKMQHQCLLIGTKLIDWLILEEEGQVDVSLVSAVAQSCNS